MLFQDFNQVQKIFQISLNLYKSRDNSQPVLASSPRPFPSRPFLTVLFASSLPREESGLETNPLPGTRLSASTAEEGGQGQKVTNESSRELMFCAVNLQV